MTEYTVVRHISREEVARAFGCTLEELKSFDPSYDEARRRALQEREAFALLVEDTEEQFRQAMRWLLAAHIDPTIDRTLPGEQVLEGLREDGSWGIEP